MSRPDLKALPPTWLGTVGPSGQRDGSREEGPRCQDKGKEGKAEDLEEGRDAGGVKLEEESRSRGGEGGW